jgi:hypothetical protein
VVCERLLLCLAVGSLDRRQRAILVVLVAVHAGPQRKLVGGVVGSRITRLCGLHVADPVVRVRATSLGARQLAVPEGTGQG